MVEADLVLGLVAMLVVEPDAVVAEPMVVVAGILAEPVEPKEVVSQTFAGVVAPMVDEAESVFVMAVPMGPVASAALIDLEVDPNLVAFAADFEAHESVSRVAETVLALEAGPRTDEHLSGLVLAPEADSRMAGFEGSRYLWGFEAVLGFEQAGVSPKVAAVWTDLEAVPGAALELDAKNWLMAAVAMVFVLQPS